MSTVLADLTHIPLEQAYLCAECACVGNCSERCPACACEVVINLANVLDRKEDDDAL